MLAPSIFEFLYAATSLLAIAVLLRRVRTLETEAEAARDTGSAEPQPRTDSAPELSPPALADLLLSPITVILGECELARGGKADVRLDVIERHARRAADLLRRPGAGPSARPQTPSAAAAPSSPEARLIDPGEFVRTAIDDHAELARERGVAVHLVADTAPPVRANPFLLGHALRNLLRTAIGAAPRAVGDVTVAVGELGGEVLFAVADDGPGLAAEQLAAIFDPATRSESASGAEALGYAVVDAVCRALGATLVLDTAPGAGTRATIRLPAVATLKSSAAPAPAPFAAREITRV